MTFERPGEHSRFRCAHSRCGALKDGVAFRLKRACLQGSRDAIA